MEASDRLPRPDLENVDHAFPSLGVRHPGEAISRHLPAAADERLEGSGHGVLEIIWVELDEDLLDSPEHEHLPEGGHPVGEDVARDAGGTERGGDEGGLPDPGVEKNGGVAQLLGPYGIYA